MAVETLLEREAERIAGKVVESWVSTHVRMLDMTDSIEFKPQVVQEFLGSP